MGARGSPLIGKLGLKSLHGGHVDEVGHVGWDLAAAAAAAAAAVVLVGVRLGSQGSH